MAGLTLDAGALIAYERGGERIRVILEQAAARSKPVTIPAVVIAEVWRGAPKDARVARLLRGCVVEGLDLELAKQVGALRGRKGAGAVDAIVAAGVLARGDSAVATSDPADMRRLLGERISILRV